MSYWSPPATLCRGKSFEFSTKKKPDGRNRERGGGRQVSRAALEGKGGSWVGGIAPSNSSSPMDIHRHGSYGTIHSRIQNLTAMINFDALSSLAPYTLHKRSSKRVFQLLELGRQTFSETVTFGA